jgi:hypothetical protein
MGYYPGMLDLDALTSEKDVVNILKPMINAAIMAKHINNYGQRLREVRVIEADFQRIKSLCHVNKWQAPMKEVKGALSSLQAAKEDRITGLF